MGEVEQFDPADNWDREGCIMPTREIPRDEWRTFFDEFSREHEGWIATIEVIGGEVPGDQTEADGLPFHGISAEEKGSEPNAVEITVGRDPDDEITHIIPAATRVYYEHNDGRGDEGFEIESADGTKTIVLIRAAADTTRTRLAGGS
jgi:hypothetical protein